ncbi:hypothetical protein H0H87_012434 [Tephrocybe sp. NHM501043]|nr:hypothetical protein H0H87_012434 [Tephrocybe sp. NHM501043]
MATPTLPFDSSQVHPEIVLQNHNSAPLEKPAQLTRRQFLQNKLGELKKLAVGDGIPHTPSHEDTLRMRHETNLHISRIWHLEGEKRKIGPGNNTTHFDDAIYLARALYSMYFTRIFRINDLPPEILANIFRYVVWPVPDPATGILFRLWLTWTCRRWREIAIADFTIWNAVWFRDRAPYKRSWAFLERARSAPLDLRLSSHETKHISVEEMGKLLDRLLPHIPQIRIFIYLGSTWEHIALLLDKLQQAGRDGIQPTSLERLEIHRTGALDYGTYGFIKPTSLFNGQRTPRLQYFSLNGVHVDWSTPTFQNLQTIDIRKLPLELSPTISRFREILVNCPALRKLCLDGAGPQFDLYDPPPFPIIMSKLKVLCISDFSAQYARHVFTHFTAPELVDLTFINMTGEDYSPLYDLLANRFPNIKLLTMYAVDMVPKCRSMTRWLNSMPKLSYLRVANLPPSFFELFLLDPRVVESPYEQHPLPAAILAPRLEVVESHPSVIRFVTQFVARRRVVGAPVRRVYVTRPKDIPANTNFQVAYTELMKVTDVHFMFNGTRTPEEDAILAE